MQRFSLGDTAVHPMHGAGTVEEIQNRRVDGAEREYYVLRLAGEGLRILVPVDTAQSIGLRPVVSSAEARQLLEEIPGLSVEMDNNWNKRYRENMARIRTGDIRMLAAVARCLTTRDAGRTLSTGERKMLNSIKQILASELVLALELTMQEAQTQLEARLAWK